MSGTERVAVAVIGAGPYGLAVAAHLKAWGVRHALFGAPLARWAAQLPPAFILRSPAEASAIAGPRGGPSCSIVDFRSSVGARDLRAPVSGEEFLRYGAWYVAHHGLSPREQVAQVDAGTTLKVTTVVGDAVHANVVVVATGLTHAAWVPECAGVLPPHASRHSSDMGEAGRFTGVRVAVVGAGQSGAEAVVALEAAGAHVTWVARHAPRFCNLPLQDHRIAVAVYARSPVFLSAMPPSLRHPLLQRLTETATVAREWRRRVSGALARAQWRSVTGALRDGAGVRLTLADGSRVAADCVVWATGYRPSVSRDPVARALLGASTQGAPSVDRTGAAERSGVYFTGAWTAPRFGPAVRFLAGTWWQAEVVARAAARASSPTTGPR
ncbi:MAG TPA: FAD-dependent oxidoreductase [Gemmatimonadales bacterium]|nr:FAD-dependent oxidoreductase [Gemmatimonadales bacterium]